MAEITPAVLAKDEEDLIKKVAFLPPEAKCVHIDVLEEDIWAPIEREFEAHLMVERPEDIIERWFARGAKAVIVHKMTDDILAYKNKLQIGLGVELDKPLEEVYPLMASADFIHLMSIAVIGEQGHPLDGRIFDRIRAVRERYPFKTISVDGGINAENYMRFIELGADRLVVGSHFTEVWTSQMKKS